MPKLPPAKKIANSVILILMARLGMCIVTASVPLLGVAAKMFYDKLDALNQGQVTLQIVATKMEGSLDKLQSTQLLAGAGRDAAITSLNERMTFLERQGRR